MRKIWIYGVKESNLSLIVNRVNNGEILSISEMDEALYNKILIKYVYYLAIRTLVSGISLKNRTFLLKSPIFYSCRLS